jgi:Family of unknown function (DUF5946)
MSSSGDGAYNELSYYRLSHGGSDFIHQHVVDACTAQQSVPSDKPIRLVFAFVGLYLYVERGFTGREVQLAHMKVANNKQTWPDLIIPAHRGWITVETEMNSPIADRDAMIHDGCSPLYAPSILKS